MVNLTEMKNLKNSFSDFRYHKVEVWPICRGSLYPGFYNMLSCSEILQTLLKLFINWMLTKIYYFSNLMVGQGIIWLSKLGEKDML